MQGLNDPTGHRHAGPSPATDMPACAPAARAATGRWAAILLLAALLPGAAAADPGPRFTYVYAGTWNNVEATNGLGFAEGVYGWRFDAATGASEPLGLVARTVLSADNLAASPDGRFLYVSEYNGCVCTRSWPFPGAPRPAVLAYRIAADTGALTLLNRADALGDMSAEMRTDLTGRTLALANYQGGNIVTYRLAADGRIGPAVSNIHHAGPSVHAAAGPHPHGMAFSPDNRWLYVADQGLDRLYAYHFDPATSALTPAATPFLQFEPGQGPRHVAVHPNGRWLYVNTEQAGLLVFLKREGDRLKPAQSVPLVPAGSSQRLGAAKVSISPDGRFLYANHRPNENVAIYAIDRRSGRLTLQTFNDISTRGTMETRDHPWAPRYTPPWRRTGARSIAWDDSSTWFAAANLGEDSIALWRRDTATGRLAPTRVILPVSNPTSVLFVNPQ